MLYFPELSRPRRDVQPSRPTRDRDVPKNASRPQCHSLKTLNGEVCHLTTCFLWVRSIIFFLIYPKAWCIAWMFTRPNVTKPETETLHLQDRDETEKLNPQDWDETETFSLQDRDIPKNVSRPRCSRPRLHPYIACAKCSVDMSSSSKSKFLM